MLVAVGLDLVEVDTVHRTITEFGDRYLRRIFTNHELTVTSPADDPVPRLAARLAAKEATVKALRVEGARPPWTTMEVQRHPAGWCEMVLSGEAAALAASRRISGLSVRDRKETT